MSEGIQVRAIGYVQSTRKEASTGDWDREVSSITLNDEYPTEALQGLEEFSHVEILFHFHGVDPKKVMTGARRPRNNPA